MLLRDLITYTNDRLNIQATLDDAIKQMSIENESHVIIVDKNYAIGMLTFKNIIELYRSGIDGNAKALDFATYPLISIHENRPIDMALEMMIDYEIRRIVLLDEEDLYIGTLTQRDILRNFEMQVHTTQEVFECLNRKNHAILIEYSATIYEAITLLQSSNRDVLLICKDNEPIGIMTEKDILALAYQKVPRDNLISRYMHSSIITIEVDEKIHTAMHLMYEKNIHHLMIRGKENDFYILNEKDLMLNYTTTLEVRLESKIRDAKATYNLLGIAFCEIIDLGDTQIIKWLNAQAMLVFQVKIDDPVSKMVGVENWNRVMDLYRAKQGVEHERIKVGKCVYELTLMETEVNNQSVLKLFLNDISDFIRLNEELSQSLNHAIELEKEKSRFYLDVASIMCLALDVEGNIVLLNPKGCTMLGVNKEEVLGKNWFDTFVSKEQAARSKEFFLRIMHGEQEIVEYYENQVLTAHGKKLVIAWHNALLKDQNLVITGSFSSGEDITKIQESEKEIQRMAHYDTLTNLPNRLLLSARLEHSLERAQREHTKVVLLYIDIDNFKDINESFGYAVGDIVIQRVSFMLSTLIRHEDTVSRVGGDEFVILLEDIHDISECERTLQQIIQLFNEPIETQAGALKLSVSIGITLYPEDGESGESLLKNADIALRRSKEVLESNYCFFTQEMSVRVLERVLMERELRRAVDEKEFVVYYQPQVDLLTGVVIGAEALVRWKHPTLGIVRPDVFIPLAESNNLIIPIGEDVLAQSCKAVQRWKEMDLFPGRISINVSGKQFERLNVVETICSIISTSRLDLKHVELEITESVLMNDPKTLGEKLIALKQLGVEIAIDDFGTGYSSLSYLKAFPIDKLKIDQSFVRELPHSDRDGALVKAIIAMADALGFKTIAEGIEEEGQAEFLKEFGCMQGQGYMYARPLDEHSFELYLKHHQVSLSS